MQLCDASLRYFHLMTSTLPASWLYCIGHSVTTVRKMVTLLSAHIASCPPINVNSVNLAQTLIDKHKGGRKQQPPWRSARLP